MFGNLAPGPKRRLVSLTGIAAIALFAASVLVYGRGWLAHDTFPRQPVEPTLRSPQGLVHLAIPVPGISLFLPRLFLGYGG